MTNKRKIIYNLISIILIAAACVYMAVAFMYVQGKDIWYDEVFSMVFSSKSFREITYLTSRDVHPPFYYFYLKVIIDGIKVIAPALEPEVCGKIASIIPWFLMLVIAITYVRKHFGIYCSAIYILLITIMPQIANYYVEIRMYSLAMLLISLTFIGMLTIVEAKESPQLFLGLGLLLIFGIITAYTQYYACVAVVGLYILLLIYLLLLKEKRKIIATILSAVISVILYIPWLPSFLSQISAVNNNYWIQPLTLRSLAGCAKFIYLPVSGDGKICYIMAGMMITATFVALVGFWRLKPLKYETLIGLTGFFVLGFVILTGFVLSILGRPIFVYRYMIPAMGVYYFSIAYVIDYNIKRSNLIWWLVIVVFIYGGWLNFNGYRYEESNKLKHIDETINALSVIEDNSLVITNFDQVTTLMDYYIPNNDIYLYEGNTDPIVGIMFNKDSQFLSEKEAPNMIKARLQEQGTAYFIGSFNSREDIIEEFENSGIYSEEIASVLLERYWFNIYKLSV